MGRPRTNNVQINIAIPGEWKKELENLARIYSVEEGKTITFLDLMRRGIQEKFRCDGMDETLKKILSEVCDAYGYIIKALEVMPDHIHIFVDCPVTVAPCDVVRTLKSMSAIQLFKAYPELKRFYARCGKLWSNGYFISSVGHISEAAVKKYIEEQKDDTTRIESLS